MIDGPWAAAPGVAPAVRGLVLNSAERTLLTRAGAAGSTGEGTSSTAPKSMTTLGTSARLLLTG